MEIFTKLHDARGPQASEQLRLPFDARQKSRLKTALVSGEAVVLNLPRGAVLRGGDLLRAEDGRVIEVVAEPEQVIDVVCATPIQLMRAAYHLGNRHVPVEIGDAYLRIAADRVLETMLRGLGATLARRHAPFEPEAGAYGGHTHSEAAQPAARIHEYGRAQGEVQDSAHLYRPVDGSFLRHGHEH